MQRISLLGNVAPQTAHVPNQFCLKVSDQRFVGQLVEVFFLVWLIQGALGPKIQGPDRFKNQLVVFRSGPEKNRLFHLF